MTTSLRLAVLGPLLFLLGCGGSAGHATRGTSADTPAAAVAEGQSGAPQLEDDLDMGTSLGSEVMGVTCDASAEDKAYCQDGAVVECDDGAWKSVSCPSPQYCGELEGGNVGCYSEASDDPEPTPEPMTGCPSISGTYTVASSTGEGCRETPSIGVTGQGDCEFLFTGAGEQLGLRRIDASGRCSNCGSDFDATFSDGSLTLRAYLCTYSASLAAP